jgi:hypothetical protein
MKISSYIEKNTVILKWNQQWSNKITEILKEACQTIKYNVNLVTIHNILIKVFNNG